MKAVTDLDTPAVTVHLDVMDANIKRVHGHLSRHGIANRPHIKTHKIPAIGAMQMRAGAVGITCQKLGEVEVFAEAAIADDILLTFNVIGREKTDRLMKLVNNEQRPVQIIFAGKAHPMDEPGKLIIQQVYRALKRAEFGGWNRRLVSRDAGILQLA